MELADHLHDRADPAAAGRGRAAAAVRRAPPHAEGGDQPRLDRCCCSVVGDRAAADRRRRRRRRRRRAGVYLLGNWPAPFGIVLVLDRLSALMLVLTGVLALASLVFSLARWHRAGPHFHTLFQFLLMGLNGAFLTGDLFNLFVFFEVLLAASYGLVLHGSGPLRVKAGPALHRHQPRGSLAVPDRRQPDLRRHRHAEHGRSRAADPDGAGRTTACCWRRGAAILGIAFLVKAGMWPLGFWLPTAYTAAAAPVAAIFAILSKVGIYVLLRLSLLLFGAEAGASAGFGGIVAAGRRHGDHRLRRDRRAGLAGHGPACRLQRARLVRHAAGGDRHGRRRRHGRRAVLSGQLDADDRRLLPADRAGRARAGPGRRRAGRHDGSLWRRRRGGGREEEVGVAMPGTLAVLGICFAACALLLAGLPPLSGFVAKFAMLTAHAQSGRPGRGGRRLRRRHGRWSALLILSGLAALIAMMRAGIRTFWAPIEGDGAARAGRWKSRRSAFLLALCLALTVAGGPVMRYMDATAQSLHAARSLCAATCCRRSRCPARRRRSGHERASCPIRCWRPRCSSCGCC